MARGLLSRTVSQSRPELGVTSTNLDTNPFSGLTGVVTGASGDIGGAIALALAELGASVCVVARRKPALEALAARARAGSHPMHVHSADLSLEPELAGLTDWVDRELGRLDFLIHSAGVIVFGTRPGTR